MPDRIVFPQPFPGVMERCNRDGLSPELIREGRRWVVEVRNENRAMVAKASTGYDTPECFPVLAEKLIASLRRARREGLI